MIDSRLIENLCVDSMWDITKKKILVMPSTKVGRPLADGHVSF